MTDVIPSHGPVEIFLVSLPTALPDPSLLQAISDLVTDGTLSVVDLTVVTRNADDSLTVTEYDEVGSSGDGPELDLTLSGLLSEEDIEEAAADLVAGASAALFVVEHLWARDLSARLQQAGGEVLATERIPAPVVNELIALLGD